MEIDYLADFADNFEIEAAEPATEILPHRNKPYFDTEPQSVFDKFLPQKAKEPEITDKDLDELAQVETDWIMINFQGFTGLGKGLISGAIFNDDDKHTLAELSQNGFSDSIEAKELIERAEIKKRLESTEIRDLGAKKKLLQAVIRMDLIRKRNNGTLKMPSITEFLRKMIVSEIVQATGSDPKVFSVIGQRLVGNLKRRFL